ncbi:hypothetical protein ACSM8L_001901, partial [Campylobacter coli]
MKTLSNIIILSALLINFSFANDLLAKLSNGAVSDNSQGVKALNLDEMKQVKGGYVFGDYKIFKDRRNLTSEVYAIVDFTQYELENL